MKIKIIDILNTIARGEEPPTEIMYESKCYKYEPEEKDEEENVSAIVKRKNISMKPMDEEEAILQIELLNHDFFVFKNIDEECVSVIYKRKDGNYGIINMK